MRKFWIIAVLISLSACDVDPRTGIERARDKWNACVEMGGRPELLQNALGVYVRCNITP